MNTTRVDTVARFFAARLSRRQALAQGGAGLAAGALAAAGLAHSARAQEATPSTTGAAGDKTMFLFVQAFGGGTIEPKAGEEGRFTLTLEGGLGQTVYFSDRPERIVGASPTTAFLAGLGFPDDNPPNAALVVETAGGETEIAVIELFTPAYDDASHTATYEVAVLEAWEDALGVGLTQTPKDLAELHPEFGAAHLFIDDCPNLVACRRDGGLRYIGGLPSGDVAQCWNWDNWTCNPCDGQSRDYYSNLCNQHYPTCEGQCAAY